MSCFKIKKYIDIIHILIKKCKKYCSKNKNNIVIEYRNKPIVTRQCAL